MFSLARFSFSFMQSIGVTLMSMSQPKSAEMRRFNNALRGVLSVSKSDLNRMLEDERRSKIGKPKPGPKPKSSASVRAASESD